MRILSVLGLLLVFLAVPQPSQAEVDGIPDICTFVIPFPSSLIWKGCAASEHLKGDARYNAPALIAHPSSKIKKPGSCLNIYATETVEGESELIGRLGMYAFNKDFKPYPWRAYGKTGCDKSTTMKGLRNASDNNPIYIKAKNGPGPGKCYKVNQAYKNYNSSQKSCN